MQRNNNIKKFGKIIFVKFFYVKKIKVLLNLTIGKYCYIFSLIDIINNSIFVKYEKITIVVDIYFDGV